METRITDWGAAMMTSLASAMALFFSAIPKILGFAVIVIVGWVLASLVERGVAAILRAVRFNDLAARSGLADFVSKMGTRTDSSGMIGLVVKWFIRLIALVVAFDALGLPAVSDVLRQLLLWLPNVVVALVVLVIGGLAARALSNVVRGAASEAGLSDFVRKMGMNTDASGMIGLVVKWFVRLIALVVAFDALGLPAVSEVLRQLLLWLPNVVVALVVLVIGGLAARALSNLVRGAVSEGGLGNPDFLAKLASVMVWAFAIVVAVNQIGIATALVNTLFMAFVGALALGVGLSFGLGGKDTAAEIVRNWYAKSRQRSGQLERTGEAMERRIGEKDRRIAENAPAFKERPPQMNPGPANKRHGSEGG